MRILHTVEFYPPSVGGAQEVVRQISERLVKLGHDVTVATTKLPSRRQRLINGVKIEEFDILGNAVRGIQGEAEKYQAYLKKGGFDVIMNYAAQQWTADLMFGVLNEIKSAKVFVPCGFSALGLSEYKDYYAKMPSVLKLYDATVYNSGDYRDINFAREHGIANTHLIPNGAGANEFDAEPKVDIRNLLGIPAGNFLVLSVGSHTGLKGHSEAATIFRRAKISNSTLLIVANDFGDGCGRACKVKSLISRVDPGMRLRGQQLKIVHLDRPSTVASYKQSDLFLFPSNVEASPLVLYESAASGLPFLVTDVGNAREIIEWTGGGQLINSHQDENGLVHADTGSGARLLRQLHADATKRQQMGIRAHESWKKRFTWEIIAKEYEKLYRELLKR